MTRLLHLLAEPFRELDAATLCDEARTAACTLLAFAALGALLRLPL